MVLKSKKSKFLVAVSAVAAAAVATLKIRSGKNQAAEESQES